MNDESNKNSHLDLASWHFKAERLGCIEAGSIEFKPLTMVCGQNNTGKTWVMYALYGFLSSSGYAKLPGIEQLSEELVREGKATWDFGSWLRENAKKIISAINQSTKRRLPSIFNSTADLFSDSNFIWDISSEDLIASSLSRAMNFRMVVGRDQNEILRLQKSVNDTQVQLVFLADQFPDINFILSEALIRHLIGKPLDQPARKNVFLMPAERNGLHLFYRELANRRSALLHHATKKDKDIDIGQLIQDVVRSRYAQPIADYIDWLNDLSEIRKKKGGVFHEFAEELKQLVGGRYDIDPEGDITFTPKKVRGSHNTPPKIALHLTSSTVKSLFGLWAYLEFEAQQGDVLMIDEPELNLHPSNQRRLGRLLARLSNSGLRIVISTHSDYLVREMNSLIMLSRPHFARKKLMEKFKYDEVEVLNPINVAAWLFFDRKIQAMEIDLKEGINATTFDDEIHELNETSDEIYYSYRDSEDGISNDAS